MAASTDTDTGGVTDPTIAYSGLVFGYMFLGSGIGMLFGVYGDAIPTLLSLGLTPAERLTVSAVATAALGVACLYKSHQADVLAAFEGGEK